MEVSESAKAKARLSNQQRIKSFRQSHVRTDFYPSPDVADILAHHRSKGSDTCLSGILDGLIRAGHRAVTGNASK